MAQVTLAVVLQAVTMYSLYWPEAHVPHVVQEEALATEA